MMRAVPLIMGLVSAGVVVVGLLSGSAQAAGEPYALGVEAIGQVEKVLEQAAANSQKWDTRRDSIQRDVYDITFMLEQAWRAAEKFNDTAMKDYAQQALTLLQRAVTQGHFDPDKIEPVFTLIRQLLPNVSV